MEIKYLYLWHWRAYVPNISLEQCFVILKTQKNNNKKISNWIVIHTNIIALITTKNYDRIFVGKCNQQKFRWNLVALEEFGCIRTTNC